MIYNDHSKLKGLHSLLSPSSPYWLRYDEETLIKRKTSSYSSAIGTAIHEMACEFIKHHKKLNKADKHLIEYCLMMNDIPYSVISSIDIPAILENTGNYIADAIGFRMTPEQILFYSNNCFGTADAIHFGKDILRIHDLKTGESPAHIEQLEIYAALFCLEYNIKPKDISTVLRIYQFGEILEEEPDPEIIMSHMDIIVHHDSVLNEFYKGE